MNWLFWTLAILILLVCVAYYVLTYTSAVAEVKAQPREPMYECPKHGLIRRVHLITFTFNNFDKPIEQCPFCYNEKMGPYRLDKTVIP